MTELTGAALIRAAVARCRELDEAATGGPWETDMFYVLAGVKPELFGAGQCAFCRSQTVQPGGEIVWRGRANINGTMMEAHQHRASSKWQHAVWRICPDGRRMAIIRNDEWNPDDQPSAGDRRLIAAFRAVAAPLADLLDGIADHTEHGGGQPQEPVYALCRAILEGQPE